MKPNITSQQMQITKLIQRNPVIDHYSALIAIVQSILYSLLYSTEEKMVSDIGSYEDVKLRALTHLKNI